MERNNKKPVVVAEIGCNHKGELRLAKEMIKIASLYCKVDAVKFQKRHPKSSLSKKQYHAPHPNPLHSYGENYGQHREYLELDEQQHEELIHLKIYL